jgi:hypothetical protein
MRRAEQARLSKANESYLPSRYGDVRLRKHRAVRRKQMPAKTFQTRSKRPKERR